MDRSRSQERKGHDKACWILQIISWEKRWKVDRYIVYIWKFDIVINAELPSDEIAMSVSLSTGALGNVRITTLKAFDLEETRKIIDGLK